MIGMIDVQKELVQYKIMLIRTMPFYGDVLTKLTIIENKAISTAATDGIRIMYNKAFISKLNQGERLFVFMHEVFHVLLMHTRRTKGRDPEIWNIAADIKVNYLLNNEIRPLMQEQGIPFELPRDGVYAYVENGVTVEALYEKIVADNQNNSNKKQIIIRDRYYSFSYVGTTKKSIYSGQDLLPELVDKEVEGTQPGGDIFKGKFEDPKELLDDAKFEKMLTDAIRESMKRTNPGRGNGPGYYVPEQFFDLTKGKALNWKNILKSFVMQKQSDDVSYATPERKYIHMDLIIPGHSNDDDYPDEVWAFIDTSGSISQEQLHSFLRQMYVIIKECKCVLNIAYWDTSVTEVYRKIKNEKELLKAMPLHSGGTNINCIYDWMRENRVEPDIMVILTDGYYGKLKDNYCTSKNRARTIQVLNSDIEVDENIRVVGKVTRLMSED